MGPEELKKEIILILPHDEKKDCEACSKINNKIQALDPINGIAGQIQHN